MKKLIDNRLVVVLPGKYVRASSGMPAVKKIDEPTQGIVIESYRNAQNGKDFQTILVDGDLINRWDVNDA